MTPSSKRSRSTVPHAPPLIKTLVFGLLSLAACSPRESSDVPILATVGGSAGSTSEPVAGSSDAGAQGGAGGASSVPPSGGASSVPPSGGSAPDAAVPDAGSMGPPDAGGQMPDAGSTPLPEEFPIDTVQAATAELYATRGGHVEGVSYRDGEVFFSVINEGLFRVDQDRNVSRYLDLDSNGTFVLADGSLLVCENNYGIVQVFADGKVGVVGSGGRCNDVTVDGWGNIYFSDFGNSITRITPDGQQSKPLTGLRQPNGLDVDPKSEFLYFMPRPSDIYRVAIDQGGPTGNPEMVGSVDGLTDGCAFDAYGNLWVSVYYGGKIGVFDPIQNMLLTYVEAGHEGLTNLTFGGPNRDTVFASIDGLGVFTIPVGVRGFSHPGAPEYAIKQYLDVTPEL